MSSLLSAELTAACNALGYTDPSTNKYYADENVIETLKDLIRYLRRDDENHDVRVQLGRICVLQTDLLPLLKAYWEQAEIFDVLLRLLVNLTTPTLMLYNEEIPTEKVARYIYLQIEEHLQRYKQSFTDNSIWAILSTKLSKILELDYAERGDENSLVIERILLLVRNILYVPSDPDVEKRPDYDANLHDQVLWALRQSGMLDIILYMASSPHEQVYFMHILELLSFMLREQSAEKLGSAAVERNQVEKLRDEAELLAIRHQENNQRKEKLRKFTSARHSRFNGTYVVQSLKSIGNNPLIYHKPLNSIDNLNFDADKQKLKVPKNRRPLKDNTIERNSAFSVRLFLKDFCVEFLNGAYNVLMQHVKSVLSRAKGQAHDESYYLWALRFFMEFNRSYKFDVKLVSETVSIQTFHFVQQQMENYFDMITTDKKKLLLWSKRLHLALLAYRELLLTVSTMDKSTDEGVVQSAKVIKSNIFYVMEYRELILTLLITFDEMKMTQTYLKNLIETQHIFLRMLQKFCEKHGAVVVSQKGKKKRKKKPKQTAAQPVDNGLDSLWDEISSELSVLLSGQITQSEVMPFDATSEVPIDEQKSEAVKNIQRLLRGKELEKAVALLRASREVWPDNNTFGSSSVTVEEEYLIMYEVFFADLGQNDKPTNQPEEDNQLTDDEEEEDEPEPFTENVIKFEDFEKRLAHPKIIRACGLCLRDFVKNAPFTNHCVIKLLHRTAFGHKMYAMVFQASIFRTFQKIFELKHMPQYKELVKFATYIMKKFFEVAKENPMVYMEVLFWKSSKDAYDVEHGYGTSHQSSAAATKVWTELDEEELRRLFEEHQSNQIEEDVVDWITENLINKTRTRKGVLKKLKELDILVNYKKKQESKKPNNRLWTETEENELRELFEEYRESDDPLGNILQNLSISRPKNRIIEKMLVMGLIQDRSELRKKRKKKNRDDAQNNTDNFTSSAGPSMSRQKQNKPKAKKAAKKPSKPVKMSPKEIKQLLITLVNKDHSEALKWLSESLAEAADDLEGAEQNDDENNGIPLVPIFEPCQTAMEDGDFKKLLKACSITEPMDEQEIYWRIPNTLSPDYIRECSNLIARGADGNLQEDEEEVEETQNEINSDTENGDRETENENTEVATAEINEDVDDHQSESDVDTDDASSSEDSDEETNVNTQKSTDNHLYHNSIENDTENSEIQLTGKRGQVASDSKEDDSKSQNSVEDNKENSESPSAEKRERIASDSEEDKPKKKKKRFILSDDEDE